MTDFVSPVFSSMISTCDDSSASVHLADLDIENAFNLSAVFEMIDAFGKDDQHNISLVLDDLLSAEVVLFAKKYGMQSIITTIRTHLFDLATQYPPTGGVFFLVAAHMAEWPLCGRLIASFRTNKHGQGAAGMRKMRRMLDWRGWTPNIMASLERVSKQIAWAVCQAGTEHATFNNVHDSYLGNGINYEGMGQSLVMYMNMWVSLGFRGPS
jgi:hypothetical protein